MLRAFWWVAMTTTCAIGCGSDDDSDDGGQAGGPSGYDAQACERVSGHCVLETSCGSGEMSDPGASCPPLSGDGRNLLCCVPAGSAGDAATAEPRTCASVADCFPNEECCPQAATNVCVPVGTCIPGRCAAPETPVATLSGERPIAELVEGDLVYTMVAGERRAVPVLLTRRTPVLGHAVARIALDSGAVVRVSTSHPTADGRTLAEVAPGDRLGEAVVTSICTEPYAEPYTYDILPASASGTYFVAGALIGSTLLRPAR